MHNSREIHIYHADAGAGKTTTMMNIIEKHVQEGIPLNRIAFVTFTRAAANVAKERVCNKFGINLKDAPHFRTIHSMCFQHLGMHKEQMMDDEKYEDFGTKAGYSFGHMGGKRTLDDVDWTNMQDSQIVAFEQLYRSNKKQAQWLLDHKIDNLDFTRYCREYVRYKNTFQYKDFTDLLEDYISQDLCEDVDVAVIDEAQDCSPLQWQVLFKAFRNAKYIHVCGDEKQCVYSFAGSDSDILLHLKGEQHLLETSYRVPVNINNFVKQHIVKDMHNITPTQCLSTREGGEIKYLTRMNEIRHLDSSKTYLFLARNKKFLKKFKEWCEYLCIPYTLFGEPVFSPQEIQQYRDGKTDNWSSERLNLAREYYNNGSFYSRPFVRIDTIHGVKGDEADIVVLMSDMSRLTWKEYEDDPNNEHKVFYVACTRARETLYILEPQTRFYYPYLF